MCLLYPFTPKLTILTRPQIHIFRSGTRERLYEHSHRPEVPRRETLRISQQHTAGRRERHCALVNHFLSKHRIVAVGHQIAAKGAVIDPTVYKLPPDIPPLGIGRLSSRYPSLTHSLFDLWASTDRPTNRAWEEGTAANLECGGCERRRRHRGTSRGGARDEQDEGWRDVVVEESKTRSCLDRKFSVISDTSFTDSAGREARHYSVFTHSKDEVTLPPLEYSGLGAGGGENESKSESESERVTVGRFSSGEQFPSPAHEPQTPAPKTRSLGAQPQVNSTVVKGRGRQTRRLKTQMQTQLEADADRDADPEHTDAISGSETAKLNGADAWAGLELGHER
ncbi:hypothetical protein B0H19DRAFT_1243300 [Mycena capillaripes]|nr:hypothetical protein B0H19DRAFT_1243300 [Mycena capillaripes]